MFILNWLMLDLHNRDKSAKDLPKAGQQVMLATHTFFVIIFPITSCELLRHSSPLDRAKRKHTLMILALHAMCLFWSIQCQSMQLGTASVYYMVRLNQQLRIMHEFARNHCESNTTSSSRTCQRLVNWKENFLFQWTQPSL